ncbi:MAG: phosphoribosylamine--glycine ligase [Candidatus Neomarinimicrobiota bacterium]|jgi:phosphoribosylamine--glycine ligase|nr:phosphoribosylamine--glycine ligase [Candidatus Neomarinimicrobiota bacterium]
MHKINIAILGSGGREHALEWKLRQSPRAERIWMLPGNGATENNVSITMSDHAAIRRFCEENHVSLLVVGPEVPLSEGIVNAFADSRVKVFGPDKAGARLESSKIYAKSFMRKYGVATADFGVYSPEEDASACIAKNKGDVVIKYDGLAAGKGVYVCSSEEEAHAAIRDLLEKYGPQAEFLIEEKLQGEELSVIGITDGKNITCLLPSQDHKAAFDGDTGPNTGGMGAYCPAPAATEKVLDAIDEQIILPTLNGIEAEGFDYKGVIYFGIMLTEKGPKLLEYNVRFGDPETEVILPALNSDLLELMLACFNGSLCEIEPDFSEEYFVDVVLCAGGYPGKYEKGMPVRGIADLLADTLCFHAGTQRDGDRLLTSGGRVLNIVCHDAELRKAVEKCYAEVQKIHFDTLRYRRDIAHRALRRRP